MGKRNETVYEEKEIPTYSQTTYYRYRTREKYDGNVDVKYSSTMDDEDLLKQGYRYTGNVKNA